MTDSGPRFFYGSNSDSGIASMERDGFGGCAGVFDLDVRTFRERLTFN